MPVPLEFSIVANEIIAPGSTITITLPRPADARSVQSAVRLTDRCGNVPITPGLAKRGRIVAVTVPKDAVGAYELAVGELADVKGTLLVERYRLPFTVAPLFGEVPGELRAVHAVRLAIGDLTVRRLAPDQTDPEAVDAVKAVDRTSGLPLTLGFDAKGERVDVEALLEKLVERRREHYGRIHETLFDRLEKAGTDSLPIVVWPAISVPAAPYAKPATGRLEEPPAGEREVALMVAKATKGLLGTLRRAGVEPLKGEEPRLDAPCVRASATVDQIRRLADSAAVGVIMYDDPISYTDLGDSISVARSDLAHDLGFDGTGVRVAVWENGPVDTMNLDFAGRFSASPTAGTLARAHSRLTSAVIKNTEPNQPHGHAPDCDLYSANADTLAALRWAINEQHCTVVSQSFHRGSEPGGAGLQSDDLLKDWMALRFPYPTIVQAAGNYWNGDADMITPPADEYVNHKGYNSLAVGNHDDTAAAMSGDSVFRNPSSAHGDRELPEIAANGTTVSAVGQSMSGTSFAAPAVAGVTALLQDVDGTLCSWPEGCRAILLASATRNVSGGTWWSDVSARVDAGDGAGAVDAQAGVLVAQMRRWPRASASRRGWDVGTLTTADVSDNHEVTTYRYFVQAPSRLADPRVKVALAWDSWTFNVLDMVLLSWLRVDLDLVVKDSAGRPVGSSSSWDNSYEIVEFDATPGETYEIVLRRWSGSDDVWFGVAWNVTGTMKLRPWDHRVFDAIRQR